MYTGGGHGRGYPTGIDNEHRRQQDVTAGQGVGVNKTWLEESFVWSRHETLLQVVAICLKAACVAVLVQQQQQQQHVPYCAT